MNAATWGRYYWPLWIVAMGLTLLVPEVYALATNAGNTLSAFVWHEMRVQDGDTIWRWDALRLLTFGAWCVLFAWLTGHLWFHLWR